MTAEAVLAFMRSREGLLAARDFLSGVLRLDADIALQLARLDEMRKKLREGRGSQAEVLEGEEDLLLSYRALREKEREIGSAIRRVPGDRLREVLSRRYLHGQPFFRIAMDMNYDERQIYRIHRQGLEHLAAQLASGMIQEKDAFLPEHSGSRSSLPKSAP